MKGLLTLTSYYGMWFFYGIMCHFHDIWSNTVMKERFLGEIIKQRRQELGITQAELCEGICEPPTLSRIENKKQTPTRNVLNDA